MAAPFLNMHAFQYVPLKVNDIVVAGPPKTGSTWMQHIIFQLLHHGTDDFRDIYEEIAWIEFKQDKEEDPVTKFNKYRDGRRTCWKTHLPLPLCNTEVGAKYVIVGRDSRDSVVSWIHFLRKYNPDFLKYWGIPDFNKKSLEEAVDMWVNFPFFYDFLKGWWEKRNDGNVMFVHYTDLKSNFDQVIRKLTEFIGIQVHEDQLLKVKEYCSFNWMKENGDRFIGVTLGPMVEGKKCNPTLSGAMIRKGEVGAYQCEDVLSEIAIKRIELKDEETFPPALLSWVRHGSMAFTQ